jgi:hypothetical protein
MTSTAGVSYEDAGCHSYARQRYNTAESIPINSGVVCYQVVCEAADFWKKSLWFAF